MDRVWGSACRTFGPIGPRGPLESWVHVMDPLAGRTGAVFVSLSRHGQAGDRLASALWWLAPRGRRLARVSEVAWSSGL